MAESDLFREIFSDDKYVRRNEETIRRWIEEGWNKGNAEIAFELYAPDFTAVDHKDPSRVIRGPAGIRQFVLDTRAEHPDIHFTIDHLVGDRNHVVGFFTVRGMTDPRTGQKVSVRAADLWKFDRQGTIIERLAAVVQSLEPVS